MTYLIPDDWMSAYLDDELSPEEQVRAAEQLNSNPSVREQLESLNELDKALRSALVQPTFNSAEFMQKLDQAELAPHPKILIPANVWIAGVLSLAACTLITIGWMVFARLSTRVAGHTNTQSAEVVRVVGVVAIRKSTDSNWTTHVAGEKVSLADGMSVRTDEKSVCEIETPNATTIRMDRSTEMVFRRPRDVELTQGTIWCRVGTESLTVHASNDQEAPRRAERTFEFSCPMDSVTQWQLSPGAIRCFGFTDQETVVTMRNDTSCAVPEGEWFALADSSDPRDRGRFDRWQESMWQLPLLAMRPANDTELQSVLQAMLAHFGRSKMQFLFEDQIRELGPTGTLPLIAFVRSSDPQADANRRQYAMSIVADLAPESARSDLIFLTKDADPVVANSAIQAIRRLDSQSGK